MKKKNIKTVMMLLVLTAFANSYFNLGAMMEEEEFGLDNPKKFEKVDLDPTTKPNTPTQQPSLFGRLKSGAQAGWVSFKNKLPGSKTPEISRPPVPQHKPIQQAASRAAPQKKQGIRAYISEKWANWNSLDKKIDSITKNTENQLLKAFSLLNNQLKAENRLRANEYQNALTTRITDLNSELKRLEPSLRRYVTDVTTAKGLESSSPEFKLIQTKQSW